MTHEEMLVLSECYYRTARDLEDQGRWYIETARRLNFLADSLSEQAMKKAPPVTPSDSASGEGEK